MLPKPSLKSLSAAYVAVLMLTLGGPAMAQTAAAPAASGPAEALTKPSSAPASGLGLAPGRVRFYEELGGKPGIDAIVADLVSIVLDDKRINATFEGVDLDRLRTRLAEQFCAVSGGPCTYSGKSMAESHEDLQITNAQFNALVENLQLALERRGVPSRAQNRLLARLAPTQREIVTK